MRPHETTHSRSFRANRGQIASSEASGILSNRGISRGIKRLSVTGQGFGKTKRDRHLKHLHPMNLRRTIDKITMLTCQVI